MLASFRSFGRRSPRQERLNNALLTAATQGDDKRIPMLLKAGANIHVRDESNQWTALHMAAIQGHTSTALLLLEAGADPAAKEPLNGLTPAGYALLMDHPDTGDAITNYRPQPKQLTKEPSARPVHLAYLYRHKTLRIPFTQKSYTLEWHVG